jgi:MoaD family protein
MTVSVKFIGSFRGLFGSSRLELKLEESSSIRKVVKTIVDQTPRFERALFDSGCENLKTNMLILVNGKEISVLNHFETMIKDGDEVVLIPVVHGG